MQATRLFDYINIQYDEGPIDEFISQKVDGTRLFYSTKEIIYLSRKLASGLLKMKISTDDKIAFIVKENSAEWVVFDLAVQYIGAVSVPIFSNLSSEMILKVLDNSEAKVCVTDCCSLSEKINSLMPKTQHLKRIIRLEKEGEGVYWKNLLDDSRLEDVENISKTIKPDDVATIIYTVSESDEPKGVMLSHNNIVSVVESCTRLLPLHKNDRVVSFLPLCHIFERAVLYIYMKIGVQIYFTDASVSTDKALEIREIRPHFFTTVPSVLEKIYEKLFHNTYMLGTIDKLALNTAKDLVSDFNPEKKLNPLEKLKYKLSDQFVYSKWREELGGELRAIVTGAASCPVKISGFFSAIGIVIMEGYGLTEASPVLTLNHYYDGSNKIGTVGVKLDICDIIIDSSEGNFEENEGEILANGPNITQGYYKKPKETQGAFKTINGIKYFKTGDIGIFVDGPNNKKYLKITGRRKEIIRTSTGKSVAPAPFEQKLRENLLIDQAMIVGDNRKYISALIIPNPVNLKNWCDNNNIQWSSFDHILQKPEVINKYQEVIDSVNVDYSSYEQVKKFALLPVNWEVEKKDGSLAELSPILKLNRKIISHKYADDINALYSEK